MVRGRMREDKLKLDKVVGDNIRRERRVRNISREELADLISLTVSHLGLIERAERGATPVVLKKLCEVLGLTVDYLMNVQGRVMNREETSDSNESPMRKRVEILASQLEDPELEVVAVTVKGILKLRNNETSSVPPLEIEPE